jgi:UDP-N-acetyl-D-glucosamine/UDP-N-acetyl-D-galactosamine dehydrogenase
MNRKETVAVIGLGYVGLPVALGLGHFGRTIGFDISEPRIKELREGNDSTREASREELTGAKVHFTSAIQDLKEADIFVVCVPTPLDSEKRPDLTPLQKASETVGKAMKRGAIVVYESTVYPGVTEEFCGPILEKVSGLKQSRDFKLGYSPERINPGDKQHTLAKIVKVVSGEDAETTGTLARVYGQVVTAGIHIAPSIKVAEAAKVLENTQRDLNIALMNELAIICNLMSIRTADVLAAAQTKWNFLNFVPGLVGGHCIGVDPYYLTARAEALGYRPEVILAGRRINDSMGAYIAQNLLKRLCGLGLRMTEAKVAILGLTFKENVPDIRNSRVPDIVAELKTFGVNPYVADPHADAAEVRHEYGIELAQLSDVRDFDAVILAVPHAEYLSSEDDILSRLRKDGIFVDIKSKMRGAEKKAGVVYWSL